MSVNRFRVTFHGITLEQYDDHGVPQPFAKDAGYQWDNMRRDQVALVQAVDLDARTQLTRAGLAHEDAMRHPVLPPLTNHVPAPAKHKPKGKK